MPVAQGFPAPWRVTGLAACVALCLAGVGAEAASSEDQVVARVDERAVTASELTEWLETHAASEHRRLVQAASDLQQRALDAVLAERLLAAESRRQGRPVEEVREALAQRYREPVTDADIEGFIRASAVSGVVDMALVKASVRTVLEKRFHEQAVARGLQALREQAGSRVEIRLEPPRAQAGSASHSPRVGSATAAVQVVVFSDFECPYCRRAAPALRHLADVFPDEVSLVWRHFPLGIHPSAPRAAEAAQCAADQGLFWEFHDALFSQAGPLADVSWVTLAGTLGLESDLFEACLQSRRHQPEVAVDVAAGEALGVGGTPTTFVNGIALVGALPFDTYERAVRSELSRLKSVRAVQPLRGVEP